MDETNLNLDAALEGVDESKRWALRRLILKGAFVTPDCRIGCDVRANGRGGRGAGQHNRIRKVYFHPL